GPGALRRGGGAQHHDRPGHAALRPAAVHDDQDRQRQPGRAGASHPALPGRDDDRPGHHHLLARLRAVAAAPGRLHGVSAMALPRIDGHTRVIAHLGHPTHSFKAPLIYNPWFAASGSNTLVVPIDCPGGALQALLPPLMAAPNVLGALITMPHKVGVMGLLDEVSRTAQVAGACNAVKRTPDGRLIGDMFDGEGFVRGVQGKGLVLSGARALVVGSGGVGSAIAASLAAAGVAWLGLFDLDSAASEALTARLRAAYPLLQVGTGERDPTGFDLVVNATP